MGTWKGDPKKFKAEFVNKNPNVWDLTNGEVDFSWEYSTITDTLEIKAEHPDMNPNPMSHWMGPDWVKAYLYTLADWMATYNSPEELITLLEPIFARYKE